MVQDVSDVQRSLDWLVTDFTERVADVAHAVVVSSEGVPMAVSKPPWKSTRVPRRVAATFQP